MESKIAEFLAGELGDRREVEDHLVSCAACREQFSLARSAWDAASSWTVSGPSGDAVAGTLAAIEVASKSRTMVRALQFATLAAVVVIAIGIGTSGGALPEASPQSKRPAPSTSLASLRPSVGRLQVRDEAGRPAGELEIARLSVKVDIHDGVARTEIEQIFENSTVRRLEGTFLFPLPPDASISRLAMEIDGKLMEGEVVEREKARQTYEGIVRSMKDPALLEWMPGGIFQCRIFPIEARSDKRIVIAYTQSLSIFDGRGRYVYPLAGESAGELGIGRFEFSAMVRSASPLASSASTSHEAASVRIDERTIRTTFTRSEFRPKADLVLAFESKGPPEIQVSAHRPAGSDAGYFAAFITPRPEAGDVPPGPRRLLFLLDGTGSVTRAELEATRTIVRRLIAKLGPDDRFRVASHDILMRIMDDFVAPDDSGRRSAERFLAEIAPAGAGEMAAALEDALAKLPDGGELVYVGEGTPTWGEKDPARIVQKVSAAIGTRRISIRTIAVGSEADRGLLETLAREFNGGAHAVNPSDDVGERAAEIARTLGRPAVSGLQASFEGPVTDAAPGVLGSLHFGERLLVTGRYGAGPVKLVLTGRVHNRPFRREFAMALPEREDGQAHVKRLWAQRRLADLVAQGEAKKEETIKVSVAHQVMTPYTSFLVLENEKAYEQHQIDRTKKDSDQTKDPGRKTAAKDGKGNPAREEVSRLPNERRELEMLFAQAQRHFETEQYEKCIDVCDRILFIDPRLSSVDELKMIAQRMSHVKGDRNLTRTYIEQWKRTFEEVEGIGIVKPEDLSFPARELWLEIISRRRPKGILSGEDAINTDFSTLPGQQFATFLDPDGGGGPVEGGLSLWRNVPRLPQASDFGDPDENVLIDLGIRLSDYDPSDGSRYRLARSYRLPLSANPAERPPQVFGINQSVSIPGSDLSEMLSLLVEREQEENDGRTISSEPLPTLNPGAVRDLLDLEVRMRHLEAQVQKERGALPQATANNKLLTASQDLQYVRQEAERLSNVIALRQREREELARLRQRAQEMEAHRNRPGLRTDVILPRNALHGVVTAVAADLDLVVISIGRDGGVIEGDEFTISRGATFVGKIIIDRVDRAWASGRVTVKDKDEPRIGDNASNNVLYVAGKPAPTGTVPRPNYLEVVSVQSDLVRLGGTSLAGLVPGRIVMLWRDAAYVATVRILEVSKDSASAQVIRGFSAGTVAAGDAGVDIISTDELALLLPQSIQMRLDLELRLDRVRLKLRILRQGKGGGR